MKVITIIFVSVVAAVALMTAVTLIACAAAIKNARGFMKE